MAAPTKFFIGTLALCLLPAASGTARACASCNCGDPTLTALGIEKPYKNRVRVAVEERYGSLSSGDGVLTGEDVQYLRSSLVANWSPWKWLTLNARLPWMTEWVRSLGRSTQPLNGLGDLELWGRVTLFHERGFSPRHHLWAQAGVKAPTGYRVYDDRGYPFPDDDQPGSGSWDPFGGLSYAFFSGGLVTAYGSTTYHYTTPGPRGYRRGSELDSTAAVQLQPFDRVAFVLGVDARYTQADSLANGADAPSTGGFVGSFVPALLVSPGMNFLLRLAVTAPVVTRPPEKNA